MHAYLVKFNRDFSGMEGFSPDTGERIGQWGLGWLSLGFGKSIKVTQIDPKSFLQLSFEKETLPLWQRVSAIVSAILLFPISLLLAGIGCIGLACSETHDKMHVDYKAVKAAKTKSVPTQEEGEKIEEIGKENVNVRITTTDVEVKSANLQAEILPPNKPAERTNTLKKPIPTHCDIRGEIWLDSSKHLNRYAEYLQPFYPNVIFLPSSSFAYIEPYFLDTWDYLREENKLPEAFAFSLNILGNHFTHVYICRKKRTIEYYDSKVNYGGQKTLRETLGNLEKLATKLNGKDPGEKAYQVIPKITKNLQPDSYQCGIWVLYFMEERAKNPDVDFNALNIKEAQKMIARHRLYVMDKLIELHKTSPYIVNGKVVD